MKSKQLFLVFSLTILITLLVSPVRWFVNYQISSLVGFIAYFSFTVICLKSSKVKLPAWVILAVILLGLFAIQVALIKISLASYLGSLPEFIIRFFGVILGLIYAKANKIMVLISSFIGLALVLYMSFTGYDFWINKLTFGTYTGKIQEVAPAFVLSTQQNIQLTNSDFRKKLVVLDFWTTSCGVCYKKLPVLQKLFEKYKTHKGIDIYAVNVPVSGDTLGQAQRKINELKYTFPVLMAGNDSTVKLFKIRAYPTVLIIENGDRIIYRGRIDRVERFLDNTN